MKAISRKQILANPAFVKILDLIKTQHKITPDVEELVFEKRKDPDPIILTRHFVELRMPGRFYIHYDSAQWFHPPNSYNSRVERIVFYDSELEYKVAREKSLMFSRGLDPGYSTNNLN